MLAIFEYRDGEPHCEVFCNGCGQLRSVGSAELPAIFGSPVLKGLARVFGTQRLQLPGVYFGPCCEAAAVKGVTNRNGAIRGRERSRGKRDK